MVLASTLIGGMPAYASGGVLTGWCIDNGSQPYIHLQWTSDSEANSNGLQKGDSYPSDSQQFWGWLSTTGDQRAYNDYAITRGTTYTYRVKYRPELPSNEIQIQCPVLVTPTPTPTSYPIPPLQALLCTPSYALSNSGQVVTFSARGGNGSYQWTTDAGSPMSGSGTYFATRFYNTGYVVTNVTHTATVYSAGQSSTCSITVSPSIGQIAHVKTGPTDSITLSLMIASIVTALSGIYLIARPLPIPQPRPLNFLR